jgi:hypothetical protein
MSTGTESLDATLWAQGVLNADATFLTSVPAGAFLGVAPQGTLAPQCVVWGQSSAEYLTWNYQRIWTDGVLMVKLSGPQDSLMTMRTAAGRASVLLARATGANQGATIISCVRTRDPFLIPEPALVNGAQWFSLVALFRELVL